MCYLVPSSWNNILEEYLFTRVQYRFRSMDCGNKSCMNCVIGKFTSRIECYLYSKKTFNLRITILICCEGGYSINTLRIAAFVQ